jgi:enterochelin esterase-like enzyme
MAAWTVTSLWLVALLSTASVILMVRAAPRWGSHRGRSAALALLLLAMAAFVNDYFGYLPQVGDIAGPRPWPVVSARDVLRVPPGHASPVFPRGAVLTLPVQGIHSHASILSALVYLPPEYFSKPDLRFPVLYMLHGSPGVPLDWFRGGEAAEAGLASARHGRPTILVAPRMSRGWLDDSECVDRPGFAAESYLTLDVIPTIDALLKTRRETQARGVIGNSSGGYCALALGLRHPDLFAHIIALSPITAPTFAYGSLADLFGQPADLRSVVEAHTPAWLLLHRPASRAVALRLDIGRQDHLLDGVRQFAALDRTLNGDPQLILRQGGHTFRTWRPALRDAVAWFADEARASQATQASR